MFQIAIDGPAGSGKSTIAKQLAKQLGFLYLSTGKMYRAYAYIMLEKKLNLQQLINQINNYKIDINDDVVKVNGLDISNSIQSNEISDLTSKIATDNNLRKIAVRSQQEYANYHNVVMDGRDIGSVVLPNAQLKFFLTASVKVRAYRRAKQLNLNQASIDDLEKQIIERDQRDFTRDISPLIKTKDAIEIDTSELDANQVLIKMLEICKSKLGVK